MRDKKNLASSFFRECVIFAIPSLSDFNSCNNTRGSCLTAQCTQIGRKEENNKQNVIIETFNGTSECCFMRALRNCLNIQKKAIERKRKVKKVNTLNKSMKQSKQRFVNAVFAQLFYFVWHLKKLIYFTSSYIHHIGFEWNVLLCECIKFCAIQLTIVVTNRGQFPWLKKQLSKTHFQPLAILIFSRNAFYAIGWK